MAKFSKPQSGDTSDDIDLNASAFSVESSHNNCTIDNEEATSDSPSAELSKVLKKLDVKISKQTCLSKVLDWLEEKIGYSNDSDGSEHVSIDTWGTSMEANSIWSLEKLGMAGNEPVSVSPTKENPSIEVSGMEVSGMMKGKNGKMWNLAEGDKQKAKRVLNCMVDFTPIPRDKWIKYGIEDFHPDFVLENVKVATSFFSK